MLDISHDLPKLGCLPVSSLYVMISCGGDHALVAGFESGVPCTAIAGGPWSGLGNILYVVSNVVTRPRT